MHQWIQWCFSDVFRWRSPSTSWKSEQWTPIQNTRWHTEVQLFSCCLDFNSSIKYNSLKTVVSTYRLSSTQTRQRTRWGCRPRISWITWSATSTTPSPECSTTPFMRKDPWASSPRAQSTSCSVFVLFVLRSKDKLADVNSTRQCVGKLADSLLGSFPLQQPNAFL